MKMDEATPKEESANDFNIYAGTETGILKGLNLNRKAVIRKNFNVSKSLERGNEITCMTWLNSDQTQVMMGLRNQTVRVFDVNMKTFTSSQEANVGQGQIVGLARWNGVTLTAVKSGQVAVWNNDGPSIINALQKGEHLTCMKQDPWTPNIIATGGKENDLQLWDLEKTDNSIFKAKNIAPDMLQLRVPVFVSGITFLKEPNCVAIASRHKHVRLYDPKRQRRPILNFEWEDSPLTCITSVAEDKSQVIVGTAHGRMGMFDLRNNKPDKPLGVFKGFAGAVRDIVVHPRLELVISVALDRFLRVHHMNEKGLLFKEYLKSRLNCVLVRDDMSLGEELADRKRKRGEEDLAPKEEEEEEEDDWFSDVKQKNQKSE